MSRHGEYNNNSIESAISAARQSSAAPVVLSERQKKEQEKRLKDVLRKATYEYQNLKKEYDNLKDKVTQTEKEIAANPNPIEKDALRIRLSALKTQKDKKYDQMMSQKRYINEFEKRNNVTLVAKPITGSNPQTPAGPVITTSGTASTNYKYNAPLVSDAYLDPTGIQAKSLDQSSINFASYDDAKKAWQNATPGKGAIQMDRTFTQGQIEGFNQTDSTVKLDTQMYGFRFLYNPKEVSMGWTTQGAVDPQFAPQDEALPISSGLMSSVVTFSLVLNRIGDMDYIDSSGLTSKFKKQNALTAGNNLPIDADPAQRNRIINAQLAKTLPYPENVNNEDLKEIWNKGTMYDIEYLFKVLNGPAATFKNTFGIETADRSYMRLAIVELHLGNNLRYRVRVSDMDVNHTIFNNRMVPILSTVRLTCQRFIDAPVVGGATASTMSAPPHDAAMRGGNR